MSLLILSLIASWSLAQDATTTPIPSNTTVEAAGDNGETVTEDTTEYGLAEFGFGVGWPGYHLYHARASFQYYAFALALEGSVTEIGPYLALSGRYYLPIPLVPTYLSAGGGIFGEEYVLTAALGAHIPLGIDGWRLGLEAGVTRVTISKLDSANVLPYVTLSVGYSFPVDMTEYERGSSQRETNFASGESTSGSCSTTQPTVGSLRSAFHSEVNDFAATLRATYAGSYRDSSYNLTIDDVSIDGDTGDVSASFSASVVEIISGSVIEGSGSISASFSWTGCGWYLEDYDYDV